MLLLYYVQTNFFCIVLFLIMIFDVTRKEKTKDQRLFYIFMIDASIFCVMDMMNYILAGKNESFITPLLYVFNTIYFGACAAAAYIWFLFTLEKLGVRKGKKHVVRHIMAIPIIALIIILALSPVLGWIFKIEDNIYSRGSAIWIAWVVAWSYIVIPAICVTISVFEEKDANQRRQYYPLYAFAVFPTIGSIIQIMLPQSSLIQVGMVISSIIVYIKLQDQHTIIDTLTGLFNRSYFDRYLSERIKTLPGNTPIFLLMMDVDDLKVVNRLMGRKRGDEVLKTLASIMQNISQGYDRMTLSRYDNDEFALFGYGYDVGDVRKMIMLIKDEIKKLNLNSTFSVDASIGFVKGTKNSFVSVDQLVDLADIEMHKIQDDKAKTKNQVEQQ